jgi:hypothetical protein
MCYCSVLLFCLSIVLQIIKEQEAELQQLRTTNGINSNSNSTNAYTPVHAAPQQQQQQQQLQVQQFEAAPNATTYSTERRRSGSSGSSRLPALNESANDVTAQRVTPRSGNSLATSNSGVSNTTDNRSTATAAVQYDDDDSYGQQLQSNGLGNGLNGSSNSYTDVPAAATAGSLSGISSVQQQQQQQPQFQQYQQQQYRAYGRP